jgi:hypothetical protein
VRLLLAAETAHQTLVFFFERQVAHFTSKLPFTLKSRKFNIGGRGKEELYWGIDCLIAENTDGASVARRAGASVPALATWTK